MLMKFLLAALLLVGAVAIQPMTVAQAAYPVGHDNSTAPHNWTHSDPNTLDPPGFGKAGDGYYYLKAYAAGSAVWCEVYSGGDFQIALENGNKTVLKEITTSGTGGRVYITNAHSGSLYMCRIANVGNLPERDYAELSSGNPGDLNSDCGGPGPVTDPNFDAAPMEPAETPGMPKNACQNPTTVPYSAGDPRLSFPPEEAFTLGTNYHNPTYSFTTKSTCDITAATFFGNQGHTGTIQIENSQGQVINGPKFGAATPNPHSANQEFVGADAGVQPAGTYRVHFAGPSNGHDLYAVCVGA